MNEKKESLHPDIVLLLEAAQFLLGQRYINAYQQVGKKDTTIIIPSEPVNIGDQVRDSLSFFKQIKNTQGTK